jgi:hypothetical protein
MLNLEEDGEIIIVYWWVDPFACDGVNCIIAGCKTLRELQAKLRGLADFASIETIDQVLVSFKPRSAEAEDEVQDTGEDGDE